MLAACGGALAPLVTGQGPDSTLLMLDRIFSSREFSSRGAGPVQWVDGGNGYTALERSASRAGSRDIVRYGARTAFSFPNYSLYCAIWYTPRKIAVA
jgi:hypothetical protein